MALIVLDASVLIAFLDARDEHHEAAVAALSACLSDEMVLPASAYAEVLVAPMRRGSGEAAKVDEALSSLAVRVEPLTPEIARSAARLRARKRGLKLPDALVLATAEILDADRVLTMDAAWSKISPRVRAL